MTAAEKKEFLVQYEEIHQSLMRFCIVKSRGIMDPKDLANDVLLVGMENYGKLENKKALLSYLFTTANRICINKLRRQKFSSNYNELLAEQIEDPTNNTDSNVDIAILYHALDQLPPLQKEAVILFEISDLPIKEIMVVQNSGASAVKQRIKRGREKLANLIREKSHKKIAIIAASLLTSSSFSMSNLNDYFNAVKDLPLPLNKAEAFGTINNFNTIGSAVNTAAAKLGSAVIKKGLFGSLIVGGVIGTSVLLSNSSNEENSNQNIELVNNQVTNRSLVSSKLFTEAINTPKTIDFETATSFENEEIKIATTPFIDEIVTEEDFNYFPEEKTPALSNTVQAIPFLDNGNNYPIAGVKQISIKNLGDHIEIQTWDRQEVEIVDNLKIVGKTPEDTEIIERNISHTVEKEGGVLKISSGMCNIKKMTTGTGNNKITFENGEKAKYKELTLSYIVKMPANSNLKLVGNYKTVTIPDMEADLSLKLFESKVDIGSITGSFNLNLKYCKGKIGNLKNGELSLFESKMDILTVGDLNLTAKYSNIKATSFKNTKITSFESDITLMHLNGDLNGNIKYSSLKSEKSAIPDMHIKAFESEVTLPNITDCKMELKYSKFESNTIKNLTLKTAFEATVKVEKITNFNGVSSKYSHYKIDEILKTIVLHSFEDELTLLRSNSAKMDFQGKYTNYEITLAKPANYTFDFDARYGNLDYGDLELTIQDYEMSDAHKTIKGYFYSGQNADASLSFECFESKIKLR